MSGTFFFLQTTHGATIYRGDTSWYMCGKAAAWGLMHKTFANGLLLPNRTLLEVNSMMVTWWIVFFLL